MSIKNALIHEIFYFSRKYLPGRLYRLRDKIFSNLNIHIKAVVEIDGIYFNIDTNNYHERGVFCFGKYEIGTRDFIAHYIKNMKEGLVIDVGANIGLHTLVMAASRKTEDIKVIAFEANPDMVDKLKLNLALNNYSDVLVYSLGLNNREGVFEMGLPYTEEQDDYHNPGIASMVNLDKAVRKIEVACKMLDTVLMEAGLGCDKVRLIKLDVEGKELDILKGSASVIRQSAPAIIVEYNEDCFSEIQELLSGYGYTQIGSLLRYGIEKNGLEENILFLKINNDNNI